MTTYIRNDGCTPQDYIIKKIETMNKQDFKKCIETAGASICNEMMAVYYNVSDVDRDKIASAVAKVLRATAIAKSNANIYFERGSKGFSDMKEYKKAKREFFKKLFAKNTEDFNTSISAALKEFNEAVPQSVKDANKNA